jgi:hypothetical protein
MDLDGDNEVMAFFLTPKESQLLDLRCFGQGTALCAINGISPSLYSLLIVWFRSIVRPPDSPSFYKNGIPI